MATVALIGPPGSGKTTMACLTAPPPVHVLDIDRKIRSMATLQSSIRSGNITYKEIGDTIAGDGLKERIRLLVEDKGSPRMPGGWTAFANYVATLEKDENAKRAKTILIDSYTQLALHMRAHIQHLRNKGKFVWDDWSTWKMMWTETTTILVDYAISEKKHLIITLHERVSEKPGEQTGRVRVTTDAKGAKQREYLGTMDVKIAGSIEGAFGLEFGSYFTDVYGLRVEVDGDKPPRWVCRVHPDGQRDLRCSFAAQKKPDGTLISEFDPDFRKIWGPLEWARSLAQDSKSDATNKGEEVIKT